MLLISLAVIFPNSAWGFFIEERAAKVGAFDPALKEQESVHALF